VAPVVNLTANPAKKPAAQPANTTDQMLPILGGALALIALGGIAYGIVRRRRDAAAWHGDWETEEAVTAAPAAAHARDTVVHDEQPAIVTPSAFAWGPKAPANQQAARDGGDDRLPGETWVERAYRGPSANNPSVSLKARLRRAAFFDKRERDVAAGIAEPIDPDAGLPEAMTEEQETELA
jgi:hypothetical protein